MTRRKDMTLTSSGFYVSQEAPIATDNPVATPTVQAPDILRCAYVELVVTDLKRSREFYVDVLGLTVTEEDENAVYLRSLEEFIHHNL
ncbi:MAG TPA: VOC family protein, partial [Humibacter sp.]|nr:VOC family protein [Humibacter sp.]